MKLRNSFQLIFTMALVAILSVSVFAADETLTGGGTNPLYGDLIQPAHSGNAIMLMSDDEGEISYESDLDVLTESLRKAMVDRITTIQLYYQADSDLTGEILDAMFFEAVNTTDASTPDEGDYLCWGWRDYSVKGYSVDDGDDALHTRRIVYTVSYYTTAEQEAQVGAKIDEIISEFGFTDQTDDYTIVRGIYHYLVNTVDYDYDSLNNISAGSTATEDYETFSAYAALIKGKSVCQGYALAFYRMAETLGVDTRLIPGTSNGQNHAWNIVKLGDVYYNLDTTWDANAPTWSYFLLSETNFATSHTRFDEYATSEFASNFPVSDTNHEAVDPPEEHFYNESVTEPTCTEEGYTTYFCPCGASYVENYTDATGHSYSMSVSEPTCSAEGYTSHTCSSCGDSYVDENSYVATIPHVEITINQKGSTCTETGYSGDVICDTCGDLLTAGKTIPVLYHDYEKGVCSVCGEIDLLYLDAPVVTATTDPVSGKVVLSWGAVDRSMKYAVYRSTTSNGEYLYCGSSKTCSFTDTSAVSGVTYYYEVHSQITVDEVTSISDPSNRVVVTADCARPVVKSSVVASTGNIKLTWNAVEGAINYYIYRATSYNGTYEYWSSTTDTSFVSAMGDPGVCYYFKVKAICGKSTYGNSALSSYVYATKDCARPSPKISVDAATGNIKLSWSAITGASKYYVYRYDSTSETYKYLGSTTTTSYTSTSGTPGVCYYYKVKAICGKSTYGNSALSGYVYATKDCARPSPKISVDAATGNIKLSWSTITGASKYYVYRYDSTSKTYNFLGSTTTTSYTSTSGTPGVCYYYKVKAICGKSSYGNSALSTYVYATKDCAQPVVSITRNIAGKPKLSWNKVTGASKYYIYRYDSESKTYKYYASTTGTTFTNTSATKGYTYYYKVKAICGKSSYGNSALSAAKSIKATG